MSAPRHLRDPQDTLALSAAAGARDAGTLDACRRLLLPLRRADAERGGDLEKTLRSYYECGCSVSKTAEALFLHRNSVRYRLDRVRALLGAQLEHPHTSAALIAAFAIDAAATQDEVRHAAERTQ
jgi:DNA-binding PucR family transcriptional regulator